ncbi:MAG: DUF1616 domain-containing protein [archaeon]|nr:DUF1616 domain-containing protein [archaeon]
MELFKKHKAEFVNTLFQSFLVTYLILLLIEQIWASSVSTYMNLNYLLIIVIILGILDVFSEHKKSIFQKPNWKDYGFISILGIAGFLIIKFKTFELGWLSWLISIIAGILIILLSLLVLEEDEETRDKLENKKIINHKADYSWTKLIIISLIILAILSVILGIFTSLGYLESLRIVFGSVFVLFLPGFIISYIFFPKTKAFESEEKEAIDWIERIALSFALSIAIVPLMVFYLNLIGIKINTINTSLIILGIMIISSAVLHLKNKKSPQKSKKN